MTAPTFLRDLAASRVLDVAGEAHKAATSRGLVVTQTILTAAASPGHPVGVVVQVQAFRGDRTPYVALFDTASALEPMLATVPSFPARFTAWWRFR